MNAIDLLMRDHRTVEKFFSELPTATPGEQERLFGDLNQELRAHMEAEERVFYTALHAESGDLINRSIQEHAAARRLLDQLAAADVDSDFFKRTFVALMKDVQTHIREEEEPGGVMATAREQLTESALDGIGDKIEQIKTERRGPMAA
jgi:hemerythrin superfamily protein